jgi:DNA-binding transcriptional LysR family regulator
MSPLLDLNQLRAFVTVAEERGFTRAAGRLNTGQPALSRVIRQLEEQLGVRLFERDTRGLELTPAGVHMLDRARALIAEATDAAQEAKRIADRNTGRLAIGFIGTISHRLLPDALRRLHAEAPGLQVELNEMCATLQVEALRHRRIDIGLMGWFDTLPQADELESQPLIGLPLTVVLSPGHTLSALDSVPLRSLRDENWLLTEPANAPGYNPWLLGLAQAEGFTPRVTRETGRAPTVLNYVALGEGITIFPQPVSELWGGAFTWRLLLDTPSYPLRAVWRRGEKRGAIERFVRQTMVAGDPLDSCGRSPRATGSTVFARLG